MGSKYRRAREAFKADLASANLASMPVADRAKYAPDQPRDEGGRFSSTGGDGGVHTTADSGLEMWSGTFSMNLPSGVIGHSTSRGSTMLYRNGERLGRVTRVVAERASRYQAENGRLQSIGTYASPQRAADAVVRAGVTDPARTLEESQRMHADQAARDAAGPSPEWLAAHSKADRAEFRAAIAETGSALLAPLDRVEQAVKYSPDQEREPAGGPGGGRFAGGGSEDSAARDARLGLPPGTSHGRARSDAPRDEPYRRVPSLPRTVNGESASSIHARGGIFVGRDGQTFVTVAELHAAYPGLGTLEAGVRAIERARASGY